MLYVSNKIGKHTNKLTIMFNPEFRNLIAEDNANLRDQVIFENGIDYIGGICTIIILSVVSYNRIQILTGFLTPGHEWLELSLIIISIGLFVICKLIADFILNELNDSFTKLRNQNEEKENTIKELEKKIKQMEKKIRQKDNAIDEINKAVDDLLATNNDLNNTNEELKQEFNDLLIEHNTLKKSVENDIKIMKNDEEEFKNIEKIMMKNYKHKNYKNYKNNYIVKSRNDNYSNDNEEDIQEMINSWF
jgi:hypothetical protein